MYSWATAQKMAAAARKAGAKGVPRMSGAGRGSAARSAMYNRGAKVAKDMVRTPARRMGVAAGTGIGAGALIYSSRSGRAVDRSRGRPRGMYQF